MTAEHDPPAWLVTRDSVRLIEQTAPRPSRPHVPDDVEEIVLEPAFCIAPTRKL